MKKRIMSMLLLVAMVVSLIPSTVIGVFATSASQPIISVEDVWAASGSTVEVNVTISGNPGIYGATLTVSWAEGLTMIDAESGSVFNGLSYQEPSRYVSSGTNFIWYGTRLREIQDGTVLKLTFEVAEDVEESAVLPVNITGNALTDADDNTVTASYVGGGVRIVNYLPGDTDSNDTIDPRDLVALAKYISDNCTTDPDGFNITIDVSAADVNDDGELDPKDLVLIAKYISDGCKTDPEGFNVILKPSTPKCVHDMQATAAKAATCTADGNIAYWYCAKCEKYFSNESGTAEINRINTIIEKTGHTVVIDEAVAPTPSTEGLTEGSHCSVCNEVIKAQEVIPPTVLKTYGITYDIANGDPYLEKLLKNGEIQNPNANYYEEGVGLTLSNLSVPGYRFLGWYDLAENGTLIKKIDATATEEYQLYAYWSKIQYTVQYKSSLFVDRAQDTYTVDTGLVLPTPKLSNYTFTGWADENGKLYSNTMIPVGTTDNLVLEANWTSERNKTWTKSTLDAPIRYMEDNKLFFVYEIGEIQNVPLYTIKDFGYIAEGGIEKSEETTFSMVISEGTAKQIAESVERATTSSSNWTLSSGWTDSTSISQEWLDEKGYQADEIIGHVVSEEGNWNISTGSNGSTDTSTGTSNEKGWSNEAKITSSNSSTDTFSTNAGVTSKVGAEGFGVKAEISANLQVEETSSNTSSRGVEMGGSSTGTKLKTSNTTTSSGWSNSSSYGGSKASSESKTTSTSVSEVVTEKYGYGKDYTSEYTTGESQGLEYSNKGSEEWSSSVTYNVETAEAVTRSWTTEQTKAGYHRWIMAGIAHVFAVVSYDMETQNYYVYTYTVMDDKTYEFEDYSYTSAQYNDHENGVISFEIPYEVAEFVAEETCYTQGLKVNQETGIITGYTGTDNCVVIPEYMNVGSGDVVKITGLAEGVFQNNTDISAVVLSDFITEIPNDCFNGCTNLEGITGGTVTKIGDRAFAGTAIVDCVVRSQVTSVGDAAFTGVDRVYFNCANQQVLLAADNCGAEKIYIDLGYLKDIAEANQIALSIPTGTKYFEIDGDGKTVQDMVISSDAAETVFTKIHLTGTAAIPVKTASEKVTFNQSSISATGIALVLSAEQTVLQLQSTVNITSENENAILAKSVTLQEFNENVDGRLCVGSKLLYVESIENPNLISGGTTEKISAETFENMLNSYTLYFDANGGSCAEGSRSVPNSTKIGTLPIPTRTHYSFEGWFLENNTQVTEESVFSTGADVTVYAKWAPVPYTVKWNGGSGYGIEVKRTASPNAGASIGVLSSGTSVYYGDELSVRYYATTGYTLTASGKTAITVQGNITASDIYASAKVNSYTVSWAADDRYFLSVHRTASPYAGASLSELGNGMNIYYGDVLKITYWAATGYSVTNHGSTSITVTDHVTASQIWATAQKNSYTYSIVYVSSNGTALGSSSATYEYGSTNTISAPAISGYITPGSQSVKWDSTSGKTITFTYAPASVSNSAKTGTLVSSSPKITYSATMNYRNRTANSVEVQITTTVNMQSGWQGYQYGVAFDAACGSVGTGKVQIATLNGLSGAGSSKSASSGWIRIPLNTTNATTVSFTANVYNTNWENNYVNTSGYHKITATWTMNIPAY